MYNFGYKDFFSLILFLIKQEMLSQLVAFHSIEALSKARSSLF